MELIKCSKCGELKCKDYFYQNLNKINGLDKYKKKAAIKKKNKLQRISKKITVLDVGSCTFKEVRTNTTATEAKTILTKELVRGILWHLKK
jgi:hypothetical protein